MSMEKREVEEDVEQEEEPHGVKKLVKRDLFDLEANTHSTHGGVNTHRASGWGTIMKLAFQCIGVVFGDLGTSPLYVLPSVFPEGIKHEDDVLGALSLIFYSIVILSLIKYVFLVLAANDNGHGGTFALYSLICRYAKVHMIPNHQVEDHQVSNYNLEEPKGRKRRAAKLKVLLEDSYTIKCILLFTTMLAVSMLLGDGVLTPVISVMSAVSGIKQATSHLPDEAMMWISVIILVLLFQIQRFGTDKVGYTFSPVLILWFAFIALIGLYNLLKHDPSVIKAINPLYIVLYFKRNGKQGWISLGGVILCLTGSEALFADLGHFNILSIQISSCSILVPSVLLAYFGQCAYLRHHVEDVSNAFYSAIPKPLYWPQFIMAVLAAIIASQSLISASFSIVQQAVALGCFPRVKVVQTSTKYEGQVYVPEINTLLMIACVGVTLGFKDTITIGNAYGIAVAFVFVITSCFLILVMVLIWKTHIILVILYALTIGLIEMAFLSSVLCKFADGGYLPLIFGFIMVSIMFTWNYGHRKKYTYELKNKVPLDDLSAIACNPKIKRLEGIALFYTPLVQGISPMFRHYLSSVPALHSVLIFVSIKYLPIPRVPQEERFLFQRVKPNELIFRSIVRYGYKEPATNHDLFEDMVVDQLKRFIVDEGEDAHQVQNEVAFIHSTMAEGGILYLLGEAEVKVAKGSNFTTKLIVDYLYNWLSRCVRRPNDVFLIPSTRLLKVGITYEV